jgi:hypothetical protein
MQGGLELAINSRVGGLGKLAERIDWSEASSSIRAVWHSDELVVWNRPIAPGVLEPRTLCRLPNGGGRHPTTMFQEILRLIAELRPQPPPAPG